MMLSYKLIQIYRIIVYILGLVEGLKTHITVNLSKKYLGLKISN